MKPIRKLLSGLSIIIGFITPLNFLHAQSTVPDSIVQLAAQTQGLNLVSPGDLPEYGTFWLMTSNGVTVPDPAPLFDPGLPVYQITDDEYLVDDTDGEVAMEGQPSVSDAVESLSNAVVELINQVQTPPSQPMTRSRMAGGMMAMDESDDFTPDSSLDTNSLYLQIIGVTNGLAYVNLNNATDYVYEVMSAESLTATNWNTVGELFPAGIQTNIMPFTVAASSPTNLFIWAMDWTGVTENGNTTPDWWFWLYFGTTDLSDTNLDSQGYTLLYDYQNGIAPQTFQFLSIEATNNYVNNMSAPLTLNVTGSPYYIAISVDDTNYETDADWQTYTGTNITVNLGLTEGWHDVWVGLRGHGDDASSAVWWHKRLKLDFTPPVLVVTNPTTNTVSIPLLQLQGYSPEALSSISYDLSNAVMMVTNQDAGVTEQSYSTNTWEFTTNYFECVDVPLTNGLNVISIHAMDMAGNITVTNIGITVDYSGKTNPPAVQLTMPQDGMQICGNAFTIRGQVDDSTVTVSASMVDTNGDTNTFDGEVERDGRFWLENLPLNSGTNSVSITVSDVVGNTTVTNISVIQSSLTLTMNPVSDSSQLWQPTVNVDGNISDSSYAVWVNGIQGTNNGDGTWSANNVPVSAGGVAIFDVTAYQSSEAPSGSLSGNSDVNPQTPNAVNSTTNSADKQPRLYVESYTDTEGGSTTETSVSGDQWSSDVKTGNTSGSWTDGSGGSSAWDWSDVTASNSGTQTNTDWLYVIFTPSAYPEIDWEIVDASDDDFSNPFNVTLEHCSLDAPLVDISDTITYPGDPPQTDTLKEVDHRHADVAMKLQTGGKGTSQRQNLFNLSASVTKVVSVKDPYWHFPNNFVQYLAVPPQNITIDGKALGSDGNLWRTYADNQTVDVTPKVSGVDYYTFTEPTPTKYHPYITANTTNLDTDTPEFCVGQQVNFVLNGLPGSVNMVGSWTLPGEFVNEAYPYSSYCYSYNINNSLLQNTNTTSCWFINKPGGKVVVGMNLLMNNGQYVSVAADGSIIVVKPSIDNFISAPFQVDFNTNSSVDISAPVNWATYVQPPQNFSGYGTYVQLIHREWLYYNDLPIYGCVNEGDSTDGQYWLDNTAPYPDPNTPKLLSWNDAADSRHVDHLDNPDLNGNLCTLVQISDQFETYLQFQPTTSGSIPVTIGRIDWGWSCNATETNGVWTWTTSTSGPTPDWDDDSFPVWPWVYYNH